MLGRSMMKMRSGVRTVSTTPNQEKSTDGFFIAAFAYAVFGTFAALSVESTFSRNNFTKKKPFTDYVHRVGAFFLWPVVILYYVAKENNLWDKFK